MTAAPKPAATKFATNMTAINTKFAGVTAGDPRKYAPINNVDAKLNGTDKSYGWVEYKQCDSRWASQQLGWCEGTSICNAGCAMSSMAMMLATRGVGVDPSSLDIWLSDNGGYYNGCELLWGYADAFGVTSFQGKEQADEESICWGLSQGLGIIANVMNGGHWVLLTACLGNGVFAVNDPGFNYDTYTIWDIVEEAVYW